MAEVVIYTRDFCYYSDAARELLTRKGVAFKEINATGQRELRAEMIEKANGASTFPQVFIGDTHVGGCDELYALEEAGQLDALIGAYGLLMNGSSKFRVALIQMRSGRTPAANLDAAVKMIGQAKEGGADYVQ